MKAQAFTLQRYDADEGMVFDWADLSQHTHEEEDGTMVQDHLYAKTLFLAATDNIENYIEVEQGE